MVSWVEFIPIKTQHNRMSMFGRPKIFTGSLSYLMPIIRHYCDIIEIFFISQFSESICNIGLKIIPLQPKLLIHNKEMSFNMLKYITNKIFIAKTFKCSKKWKLLIWHDMLVLNHIQSSKANIFVILIINYLWLWEIWLLREPPVLK